MFEEVAPLVQSVLDGFNVCIFAYGQTGSGKTFTMVLAMCRPNVGFEQFVCLIQEGPPRDRGVNHRALQLLFRSVEELAHEMTFEVSISMLEIYNVPIGFSPLRFFFHFLFAGNHLRPLKS